MLISVGFSKYYAQTKDTLVKSKIDSLKTPWQKEEEQEGGLDQKIVYEAADSVVALPKQQRVLFYGKSKVDYGSFKLQAEVIDLEYGKNIVTAYGMPDSSGKLTGNPKFNDGSQEMEAEKIKYNIKTKKGKIYNALTKQGELLVRGQQIKKDSTNIIYMNNMECIPCKESDARTIFKATKAKIIPNDKIVTGPMYLEIGGVPTPLALPFGFFPNTKKQKNGILFPTFGNSTYGYQLRDLGFYWGINNKTDMVAYTNLYTNGSFAVRTINNYNVLYKARGSVGLEYSTYVNGDKDIPSSYSVNKGYKISWLHTQDNKNNPSIRFSAQVNFVKNQSAVRFNSGTSGGYLQNSFNSQISFSKTFKVGVLTLSGSHNQSAIGTKQINLTLPQLTFNANRFFPFKRANAIVPNVIDKIGVTYLLDAKNNLVDYDSTFLMGNIGKKLSNGMQHTSSISTNFNVLKYFTLTPSINLRATMFTQKISQHYLRDNTTPINGLIISDTTSGFNMGYEASFSTNLNTKVFIDNVFKKGKLKQIRHMIIPNLTYVYRPDFSSPQFGFYKKVQRDTLGNMNLYNKFPISMYPAPAAGAQNALNFSISDNIEAKIKQKTDTGISYKKITLIQNMALTGGYNFAADSFQMNILAFTARTVLFKYIDVVTNGNFDPYAYNASIGRRVNKLQYDVNGLPARLVNAGLNLGATLSSDKKTAQKDIRQAPNQTNGAEAGTNNTPDFQKQPWNLRIGYALTIMPDFNGTLQPLHTIQLTGDFKPTKFWKLGLSTNYDLNHQKIAYTKISIHRDLKCWEARIDWVPFGLARQYLLTINLRSSLFTTPFNYNNYNINKRIDL
ncbi:MAG: LPS-assembly protein LptD [Bacteroidetes bacterium]|nr:LPS-assembly protein LptD [Bacteroidota bacterium]